MYQFLHKHFPPEIVCEIALFEGSVLDAYLRDYICELYTSVYKRFFGRRYSLKYICTGHPGFLPFYASWSTWMRLRAARPYSAMVTLHKQRKSQHYMKQYQNLVPLTRLVKERKIIEDRLSKFFPPIEQQTYREYRKMRTAPMTLWYFRLSR